MLQGDCNILVLLLLFVIALCIVQQQSQAHRNFAIQHEVATDIDMKKLMFERVILGNDGISQAISLPFEFDFFGKPQKDLFIHAHGYLTFGAETCTGEKSAVNERLSAEPNVAAFWTDLDPSSGSIEYADAKDERGGMFIARWMDKRHQGIDGKITFLIVLFEDGNIEFQYESISPSLVGSPKFIGVQTMDRVKRLEVDEIIPAIALQSSNVMVTGSKRLIGFEETVRESPCHLEEAVSQETKAGSFEEFRSGDMDVQNVNSIYQVCDQPSAPRNLRVLEYGLHSVTLAWEPPTFEGDPPFENYQINVTTASSLSRDDTTLPSFSVTVDRNETSFAVTGLDPHTLYIFSVQAISNCTEGTPPVSNLVEQATIRATPPTTPPFDLFILDVECTSISLQWSFLDIAPFNGGSEIIGFTVEFNPSGFPNQGFVVFVPDSSDNTPSTVTLRNLVPATEYEISIRAVNAIGCGPCASVIVSTLFCFP